MFSGFHCYYKKKKTEKAGKRTGVGDIFCIRGNRILPLFLPIIFLPLRTEFILFLHRLFSCLLVFFFLILLLNKHLKNNIHIRRKNCLHIYNNVSSLGCLRSVFLQIKLEYSLQSYCISCIYLYKPNRA